MPRLLLLLSQRAVAPRRSVCGCFEGAPRLPWHPVRVLFRQILNPFYVFQCFTLTLWYTQGYVEYSSAIVILSVISIGLTIYDLRQVSSPLLWPLDGRAPPRLFISLVRSMPCPSSRPSRQCMC